VKVNYVICEMSARVSPTQPAMGCGVSGLLRWREAGWPPHRSVVS